MGGTWLLQCPRCRLAWWNWPAFDPAGFYDRDYFQSSGHAKGYDDYAALESGIRRTARSRLRTLTRLARDAPGRLFDIGCGTGVFLETARQGGWTVAGLEVSPHAAAVATERGIDVRCWPIETFRPAGDERGRFDCVTLWDCIEHLRDPLAALTAAAALLRPGGCLALSTGDVTSCCARWSGRYWHLLNLPEHLFFFSPKSLTLLLRRAGFRIVYWRREINWVSAAYLIERLVKSWRVRPRPMPALASRLFVPATLADVVGLYARKAHTPPRDTAHPQRSFSARRAPLRHFPT